MYRDLYINIAKNERILNLVYVVVCRSLPRQLWATSMIGLHVNNSRVIFIEIVS